MLTSELVITVPGNPAPKGSLKCIGGRGSRGHVLIEDNPRTKEWRTTVAGWVRTARNTGWGGGVPDPGQPIGAEVTFTLERPKGHYGTGRNAGTVKATAPAYPVSHATGDIDKLLRLILDALQDTDLLPDDCAVCEVTTKKAWTSNKPEPVLLGRWAELSDVLPYPGVRIRLYPLNTEG